MIKWTCRCGQAMNDHKAPDPNAYSVYSDELFEEISHAGVFWLRFEIAVYTIVVITVIICYNTSKEEIRWS